MVETPLKSISTFQTALHFVYWLLLSLLPKCLLWKSLLLPLLLLISPVWAILSFFPWATIFEFSINGRMFRSLPHRQSQIRHFHSAISTPPPGPTRTHFHLLGMQLWNSDLFLCQCKKVFQRRDFTATVTKKKKQFIFVLIYSLTCKKIPVQYFNILLPVSIAWIKQSHLSLNCRTSNILSITLF